MWVEERDISFLGGWNPKRCSPEGCRSMNRVLGQMLLPFKVAARSLQL